MPLVYTVVIATYIVSMLTIYTVFDYYVLCMFIIFSYYHAIIYEEKRDPNHWFYQCAVCDNSVHPNCVFFGKYSFIKIGRTSICRSPTSSLLSRRFMTILDALNVVCLEKT